MTAEDFTVKSGEAAVPVALLHELLRLDRKTGRLYWLARSEMHFKSGSEHRRWNTRYAGAEAFTALGGGGYRSGKIFGRTFRASRVVFAMAHGRWPAHSVDHISGDTTDNRPDNLRDVSHAENCRNQAVSKSNSSGTNGVTFHCATGKWRAQIGVDYKVTHLGYFDNIEDAIAARKAADARLGYHKNHGRAAMPFGVRP